MEQEVEAMLMEKMKKNGLEERKDEKEKRT
jgi:hypothetical protein